MHVEEDRFLTLPITGARLVRLRFCGNGKDSEVLIDAEGARKTEFPLCDARMDLSACAPLQITTRGWGDTSVALEIVPIPGMPVLVAEAAVGFDGDDEYWDDFRRGYLEPGVTRWAVQLRLRLANESLELGR
jgi:hypothetical protein